MEFTDQPLEPVGHTLLDATLETSLGLKTAMVFRIIKLLQRYGYLPDYGYHMAEVCLEEALANAMVHGNKLDPEKQVHLIVSGDEQRLGIIIEDEGQGFSAESVPDPNDPEIVLRERGRGIMLISSYMEQVQYNRTGTRLRMLRRKQLNPDPGATKPVEVPVGEAIPAKLDLQGIDLALPGVKTGAGGAGGGSGGGAKRHVNLPDEIDLGSIGADAASATSGGGDGSAVPDVVNPNAVAAVLNRQGVTVVRFQARHLTEDNVSEVRLVLQGAFARNKPLVFDMAEVEFMSSVGISTLIAAHKQAAAAKQRVVFASMGAALRNVLKATGLLRLFTIEADQDAAIQKAKG